MAWDIQYEFHQLITCIFIKMGDEECIAAPFIACRFIFEAAARLRHNTIRFSNTYKVLEIISFVMGPFSITSKILGEFNFVIGGSRFVMLNHLALSPLPLVDGKFPSENRWKLSRPKISCFWGIWAKEILVYPGNCPKKVPKIAQILQSCLARKMRKKTWLQTKYSKKGCVEGTQAEKLTFLGSGSGKTNKQAKESSKMTNVNQNPHTNKTNIDYKFKTRKPAQITP